MVDVFLEAMALLLVPLTIAIIFIDASLPMRGSCEEIGEDTLAPTPAPGSEEEEEPPVWRYFFQAYIRAGLLEELTKYFAIRR